MTTIGIQSVTPQPTSHLSGRQQHRLQVMLVERLRAARNRADQAATVLDSLTVADSPQDREIAHSGLTSVIDAISRLEFTLERLDAGTYGICSSCARPIPFERLEAIPEVHRCVRCVSDG